ncbi:MAG: malonate decarboxylase subunit alpha [Betaproteobacteria bacterium]|nr:malonate decarboxylase subunit alpha [Betaproteobacteria bacterium]
MSRRSKMVSFEAAARLVRDGSVLAVSSSSGLNCPDRMLAAIGERFASEGHPREITFFMPIAAGDMYGIKGIDHIARKGLLRRVVGGSYPSGPSSLEPPAIWKMISANEVEAYNFPSGVLFDMLRDVAARRAGVLTRIGLDTFVDPRRHGGKMNRAAREDLVRVVEFGGEEWLHFPNVLPNIAIVRGTSADPDGNVSSEHEGAPLGALDVALATHNAGGVVIAQVKRLVDRGAIPAQHVAVPSTLVDYVVVDPDQMQATQTRYDPALSGEAKKPRASFERVPFGPDKVIARRAALELAEGDAVNLGFGISPLVPLILLEEGDDEAVTWAIEQGPIGGIPAGGFVFGCAFNAQAIIPSPQQFTYFQGAGFDLCMLSFLEIDRHGSVNVSQLSAKPHVTAGCGGFVDITSHARRIVFSGYFRAGGLQLEIAGERMKIAREGSVAKLVPEVEHVTFSGRRGRAQAQEVTYITERCVLRLAKEGLEVTEIAPGIDLERDVLARAGFPLSVSPALKTMDARLFRPEPMKLALKERRT